MSLAVQSCILMERFFVIDTHLLPFTLRNVFVLLCYEKEKNPSGHVVSVCNGC